MIFVPQRKFVVLTLFIVLFAVSITLYKKDECPVFSGEITKVIIIDAGHGLPDGGAVGMNGTIESEINIQIANILEKLLSEKGYKVIMTRKDEHTIANEGNSISERKKSDMHKRLDIINNSNADMFVSIHMNKFSDSRYKGAQVIYSGNFTQSEQLASFIQKKLHLLPDNKSERTHAKAPSGIFLLKNSQIPAVIVECGFLSNYEEEKLLNTEKYQHHLAKAIAEGIEDYYKRSSLNESVRN